jgi:hypothetical protein
MSRRNSRMLAGMLALTLLVPSLAAQGDKITLKLRPAPNQTIHIGMQQQMAFTATAEGLPSGPMKIDGVTEFSALQKVGAPDAKGNLVAEMQIDSISIAMLVNGMPMPALPLDSLKGQTVKVTYDPDGKVIDAQAPGMNEAVTGSVRGMVGQFAGSIPNATLGIGDTVSAPLNLTLPIPVLGASQTSVQGRNLFQLLEVTREGGDRIARLKLTTEASMNGGVDMKMTGTGTMDWNVDKGFLKNGSNNMNTEMTLTIPGGGTMHLTGTIKMTITGESRAP